MKSGDALNIYVQRNKIAQRIVSRLIAWDSDDTSNGNAKRLGISLTAARIFAHNYKLSYVKVAQSNRAMPRTLAEARRNAIRVLSMTGWSVRRIGLALGISGQRVDQIYREYRIKNSEHIKLFK